ncbi:MAG: hypothetical protein WCA12_03030 [Burkholderiales bacterium]
MNFTATKLVSLLPQLYRIRDAQQRPPGASGPGPLEALLGVIANEVGLVEADIAKLYDDWFIETCNEWVVPYIGDLIGARNLHPVSTQTFSRRAWVANTLGYRRRKGTATMLEQLARDTTGWPAHAVEFFERLAWSQNVNHVRLHAPATLSLRSPDALERVNGAFDPFAHTLDVRAIERGRGVHNIPNVGLFLWRLSSYPVGASGAAPGSLPADYGSARAYQDGADGRYTFSPLGLDGVLFNNPQSEETITQLAGERNVPDRLRRRALHDEVEALRQALVDGDAPPPPVYFDGDRAVLRVITRMSAGGALAEIAPAFIGICNLEDPPPPALPPADWRRPVDKTYVKRQTGATVTRTISVAVDPASGRLAFPAGVTPHEVFVLYSYGFPGDVGGGPYNRAASVDPIFHASNVWQVGVSRAFAAVGPEKVFVRLAEAVAAWNAEPAGRTGVIVLMDSTSEFDDPSDPVPEIRIKEGSRLLVIAASWPIEPVPGSPGAVERRAGQFAPDDVRAHFRGELVVDGSAPLDPSKPEESNPGELTLNGLMLEGRLRVREAAVDGGGATIAGNLGKLAIVHSTLTPVTLPAGLLVSGDNRRLELAISRSIVAKLELAASVPEVNLAESIVDGAGGDAIAAPGAAATFERCTVLGAASAKTVSASNSIFTGALIATRRQTGCVRFSSLTEGSKTPRRHRCQPDLALSLVAPAAADATRKRLVPQFVTDSYGDAAYAQLAQSCALEIRTGADDGAEMGVWALLAQPQREANLLASLDEYLRFGLAAGIRYVT